MLTPEPWLTVICHFFLLPRDFPLWREDGRYRVADLASWFERQVRDLEARFNARNGTVNYSWFVDKTLALAARPVDWPLGQTAGCDCTSGTRGP